MKTYTRSLSSKTWWIYGKLFRIRELSDFHCWGISLKNCIFVTPGKKVIVHESSQWFLIHFRNLRMTRDEGDEDTQHFVQGWALNPNIDRLLKQLVVGVCFWIVSYLPPTSLISSTTISAHLEQHIRTFSSSFFNPILCTTPNFHHFSSSPHNINIET